MLIAYVNLLDNNVSCKYLIIQKYFIFLEQIPPESWLINVML